MDEQAGSDPIHNASQGLETPRVWGFTPVQQSILAIGEILLCSGLPTQILLGSLLQVAGIGPVDVDGGLSIQFVLTVSIADTVLVIALMVMLTRAHGESPLRLWLGDRPIRFEALLGLMLIPFVFLLVVVLLNVLRMFAPWLHNVPVNPLEQLASTPGQATAFALVAIFAGGVREELQRVFLLQRFERHLGGAIWGVVILSVAFGLGHIVQGWDAVITTGVLGAFWAILYLRRGSVVAPLVSHAGFNALEVARVAISGQ